MISASSLIPKFQEVFGPIFDYEAYFAPGRVNLMGDHIDYNGGSVLPFAIDLGITALFVPDDSSELSIYSIDFDDLFRIDLKEIASSESTSGWEKYVIGSLKKAHERTQSLRGGKIILQSDLPLGAGLSSSAAIECLVLYMMAPEFYDKNRLYLALDAQTAEVEEVGVECGIMDQYAIAFGKKGFALLIDTHELTHKTVPLDFKEYQLVVMNTNVSRSLITSKYNERKAECERALQIIQKHDPAQNLTQSHEISIASIEDDVLYYRAKHVITEQQRTIAAYQALMQGELKYFGDLMWMSHTSLDEDYEVAGDALNCLVYYSHKFRHCIGARMTGAGFGGNAIALVEKEHVKRFCDYVGLKYEQNQGREADFYLLESSNGVKRLK